MFEYSKFTDKFISKWLVFFFDIFIVTISLSFATIIFKGFKFETINYSLLRFNLITSFIVSSLFFLNYKTFSGIIRHTSLEDTVLIFKTLFLRSLFFMAIGWFSFFNMENEKFVSFGIPIYFLEFLISSIFLVAFRLGVKFIFEFINKSFNPKKNVLIYGAGYSGRFTKNLLNSDKNSQYEVIGFVDDNSTMHGKTIEGLKVYSIDEIESNFFNKEIHFELIIAIPSIEKQRRTEISEIFLTKGIMIKTLPPLSKWNQNGFSINQISKVRIEDLLGRRVIEMENPLVSKEINSKIILVTGAAGSIGSEISRQLVKHLPSKLILIDQSETGIYDLENEIIPLLPRNVKMISYVTDICNSDRIQKIFREHKPDWVFHAAAYKHVPLMEANPYESIRNNVFGTKILADISVENNVSKFVMISTDKAVNPTNVMGATKRLAEMYTQSYNHIEGIQTKFIATRFGNVLGSNGSVIPLFRKQIELGGPITITHPEITRYFMTIPEACELVLEAGTMGGGGEVFVFDMGESVKIIDLAKKMITLSGLTLGKDIEIKVTGLRPGEKLYEELLSNDENTLPTHHDKILIAKVNTLSHSEIEIALSDLESLIQFGSHFQIVSKLKEIIPEYLSNNSIYENLDKELKKIKNKI